MKILLNNQCLFTFILLMLLKFSAQIPVDTTIQFLKVSRNGTVELCHNEQVKNAKFNLTLEKGNNREVVCQVYTSGNKKQIDNWENKAQCHFNETNHWNESKSIFFITLTNLNVKHTDTYTCNIKTFAPPPFKTHVTKTFVYVHDAYCDMSDLLIWILCGVASFFFLCCIIMIYITIHRRHCKERETKTTELSKESNSEYMHMAAVPLVRPSVS
ncbi:uncharacterized protein [Pyxicephalus adspersus]|uniref:uncharacterized protein n=1 Tax=Pyxicephalus adspersus TaxID=30357 RepID=UPI003B5B6F50